VRKIEKANKLFVFFFYFIRVYKYFIDNRLTLKSEHDNLLKEGISTPKKRVLTNNKGDEGCSWMIER